MTPTKQTSLDPVRRLRDAGIEEAHAEAITASIHSGVTGGVATKADIAELRIGLRWVAGIGAGIVAILVGAFGFLFNMLVGMTADIATLQTTLAVQGTDVAALQASLAAQATEIAAIKEAVTALATR